ncbi:MAG: RNA polymerase sigma factor [Proteobacteria bacterium]|nr:RNA polymerase sigma factor [Pseudomonadota bacterium]
MTSPGSPTDEALAARAKLGERAAFEELVRRHKDGLYRFVRRYVGHADDAYDVLQDCLASAWLGLHRYEDDRPFAPWIRTIALNKCRDFGRRQRVRAFFLRAFAADREAGETVVPAVDEAEPDAALESERLDRLDRAIAELPAFYKEPLLLTTAGGLSHDEAAAMLNTTAKAIEMRLYRARRKLQTVLGTPEG